jgi:2-dehydropantoate 2-reductase
MNVIFGAGAMGGMLAAKIINAGFDVTLVDVSQEIVSQINNDGLQVEYSDGLKTFFPNATSKPEEIGSADIVYFFVKAQHTRSAAKMAKPLIGPHTTVVSLQNGWGNADVLNEFFPSNQIVVGVTYNSATVRGIGKVAHTGNGVTFVGPYDDDETLEHANKVGEVLSDSGFEVNVTPKVKTEIWKKLILNAATLPTAALTRLCAGDLGQSGATLDVVDDLTREAVQVAQAQGYNIELEERISKIHSVLQGAGKGKASMLQDVEGKRKTEIEVVNGAVVKAAEKYGVEVPLNNAMVGLIVGLEKGWAL